MGDLGSVVTLIPNQGHNCVGKTNEGEGLREGQHCRLLCDTVACKDKEREKSIEMCVLSHDNVHSTGKKNSKTHPKEEQYHRSKTLPT